MIVEASVRDGVGLLRLNRPEARNALSAALVAAVRNHLETWREDDAVRVVVLTGAGTAFCAGADVTELRADPRATEEAAAGLVGVVARYPKPVVAAVNGHAYGGGAELAAACDLRVVAESARFCWSGLSWGMVVGTSFLPRIVGAARAKDLLLTCRPVSAREAEAMGLANRVVADDRLLAESLALAAAMATIPARSLALTKALVDESLGLSPAEAHDRERRAVADVMGDPDFRRRLEDFVASVKERGRPTG